MIGLARLGRDAEIRSTPSGHTVANLDLVFSYGQKDSDGRYPSQWVRASLWGQRAESLAPFLLKGSMHCFTLSDLHVELYDGRNGTGANLIARVDDVTLGPRQDGGSSGGAYDSQPASGGNQRRAPAGDGMSGAAARQAPPAANPGFDGDDDIPF